MNTKQQTFKNQKIPNEIINIILSYRNIHPVSLIFKNEYINSYNKKYIKNMKEIIIDLTYGLNRANHFNPFEFNIFDDLTSFHFENNNSDDNTDNESYNTDIQTDNSDIQTDNTELLYNSITENEYDDNYENNEEQWALSNRSGSVQIQAINCYFCGEYKLSETDIPNILTCYC